MERIKNVEGLSQLPEKCTAANLREIFNYAISADKNGETITAAFFYLQEAVDFMCATNRNQSWYLIDLEQ